MRRGIVQGHRCKSLMHFYVHTFLVCIITVESTSQLGIDAIFQIISFGKIKIFCCVLLPECYAAWYCAGSSMQKPNAFLRAHVSRLHNYRGKYFAARNWWTISPPPDSTGKWVFLQKLADNSDQKDDFFDSYFCGAEDGLRNNWTAEQLDYTLAHWMLLYHNNRDQQPLSCFPRYRIYEGVRER